MSYTIHMDILFISLGFFLAAVLAFRFWVAERTIQNQVARIRQLDLDIVHLRLKLAKVVGFMAATSDKKG